MPESSRLEGPDPSPSSPTTYEHPSEDSQRPLLSTNAGLTSESCSGTEPSKHPTTWYTEIYHLLHIPGLRFSFTVFFAASIAFVAKAFVYQHASESFGWQMSTTTWLRVSQAVGASIITLLFLPILNTCLHKRGYQSQNIDLMVLRGSFLVAAIGFAILGQAEADWLLVLALFVCGLSEAIQPANQGLATAPITRRYNARLFTTAAVLETVGKLAGGPIQSALFSVGRREGHGSLGINFLASSVIFVLLLGLALVVRIKR
ncbi:MAG: hypothetical protein Q9179_005623 [Wetmoreana sp. 5 TL-2023]